MIMLMMTDVSNKNSICCRLKLLKPQKAVSIVMYVWNTYVRAENLTAQSVTEAYLTG